MLGKLIMRIVVYSIVLALFINACTTVNIISDRMSNLMYVDSALKPYMEGFLAEANKRGIRVQSNTITMIFGKTKSNETPRAVGTCSEMSGRPLILIDKTFWDEADAFEREELVFHELGHCLLDRDHCEAKENGESVSMMEPDMLPRPHYQLNRDRLVNELFFPDDRCLTE